VRLPDGTTVGTVTSGSFAPSLGHAVALAWIDKEHAGNANFEIMTAKTSLPAARVELPFYTQGSVRVKLP
jgi:aminomethyltransferase